MNGFEIIMISSGDLATTLTGIPDLQLLSLDEFVWTTDRITNMTSMPLIIDADNGFGRPINAYYACQRLRKAGAAGVLITDAADEGREGSCPSTMRSSSSVPRARAWGRTATSSPASTPTRPRTSRRRSAGRSPIARPAPT